MKRYSIFIFAILITLLATESCKKDLGNTSIELSIFSSEKSENQVVNLEILGLEIHYVEGKEKNKWIEIPMDTLKLDISEISMTTANKLGSVSDIAVGRVDKIRLKIGTNHMVLSNGTLFPLSIENVTNDYATLSCNVYMKKDKLYTYFLDFNAKKSVTGNEAEGFILNPILILANVYENEL